MKLLKCLFIHGFVSVLGILAGIDCFANKAAAVETAAPQHDKLVVHEWGTFTSLQDETGKALGGINVDDEPVPPFVHQVMGSYVLGSQHYDLARENNKGAPDRYPFVTMRLETPVMYFYPPKSLTKPLDLDVHVQFRGGWLTQFYPAAQSDLPQPKTLGEWAKLKLDHNTISNLEWNHLQVGTQGDGPETTEPVWLAPRNVAAANVTTPAGESERYLFYRGVGNIDSPLSVSTVAAQNTLTLQPRFAELLEAARAPVIRWLWLVKIDDHGAVAYRALKPIESSGIGITPKTTVDSTFTPSDFAPQNLARLQQEMHAALVSEGLFDDEATAMLTTWEHSYFRSGGWRLFFIVPSSWTEHYLPLRVSQPAEIKRVMMGRIELVSPEQRALLKQLANSAISTDAWIKAMPHSPAAQKFFAGRSDFGDLGVAIPPDYQLYLSLGRFRNALLNDEQAHHPSAALAKFITNYSLQPFQVAAPQGH
ncbi:MAG TPA: hypothetical protein VFE46_06350 [Pirellulales bacterium]|jgi:hypothetical protein|nr:hypothetical protein [Pirellulales bacterium]